ncbi:MAG TPA: uracil-DNA glycosylase [Coxiellaceae bacterium]|nr:uracil-DNA glycosylase [Coxiellaceae bacterium]
MAHKKEYLKEMGIDIWQDKSRINDASMTAKTSSQNNLEDIKKQVVSCKLCDLHKTCTNTVFGVGNEKAKVMFIGEAPGANEDLKGEPFVGRAGMLLNSMLRSIGLERTDVYIANILKCRPPNNRDPLPQEVKLCTPYLQQQIALIQPKVLIAVGRIAAQFLLNTMESMSKLRGNTYQYGEQKIPLLVTYHPAYLLRSPSEKRKAYVDFLLIKKMVE